MSTMIACPTRGHVWYETAMSLTELTSDPEVGDILYVQNKISALEARNEIVRAFLETPHDSLVMIDDDVVPPQDVLDLVAALQGDPGAGIVGAPCPLLRPGLPVLPNIFRLRPEEEYAAIDMTMTLSEERSNYLAVDAIGFGCVALRRELVEQQQTFHTRVNSEGELWMSEDLDYCLRASELGYKTMVQLDLMCEHMVEVHAGGLAQTFLELFDRHTS